MFIRYIKIFLCLGICFGIYEILTVDILRSIAVRLAKPSDRVESEALDRILTARVFSIMRIALSLVTLVLCISLFFFKSRLLDSSRKLAGLLEVCWRIVTRAFAQIPFSVYCILAIYFAISIYLLINLPLHYDEAYSSLYYSGKGFLVSAVLYNATNNHILFNELVSCLHFVWGNSIYTDRLVNVLFAVLLGFFTYLTVSKHVKHVAGLMALCLLLCLTPFIFYTVHARGYLLYALMGALHIYAVIRMLQGEDRYFFVFCVSAILGAYTIPTFIYCFVPSIIVGLSIKSRKKIILKGTIWVGIGVFLLYLPVFIVNGYQCVLKNEQVVLFEQNITIASFVGYVLDLSNYFSLFPLYLIVLIGLGIKAFEGGTTYKYFFLLFVFPILIPLVQGFLPPPRIYSYLFYPLVFVVGQYISSFKIGFLYYAAGVILLFAIPGIWMIYKNEQHNFAVRNLYSELSGKKDKIFVHHHPTLRVSLLYYNRKRNVQIEYSQFGEMLDSSFFSINKYDRIFTLTALELSGYSKKETENWIEYQAK